MPSNIEEIMNMLKDVLNKKLTREEVSNWAEEHIICDFSEVFDTEAWELITIISGLDLQESPGKYLHSDEDIVSWINSFQNKNLN